MRFLTETSSGAIIEDRRKPFQMALVEPIKGKPGKLIGSVTVWADNLPHASRRAREDAEGVVAVEMDSYKQSVKDYMSKLDAEEKNEPIEADNNGVKAA